ncbi:RagB/SusD family nutrient uptake outer membrane protein [Mangrovivirga sp. M17]|uniref:RagB/SusD family nutrient uptake outer membrane protein n=1 Tax=Mangrovivirga halotolerans TaxID=2993936 RepID=A0ABT3RKF4_9BACT|nr:RagB/SusD family nutrient uptake outer membrane protein [Mangrovivirga halotolerans]MCX2742289.1 RagB/SusD family nutrient uptake outer membrane protein [Mangrovivirga halotolerans]
MKNKYIKLIKMIMAGVIFSSAFISCDNLDDPLEDIIPVEETDYTDSEGMTLMINGSYDLLYNLQWETFPLISVRGDDVNAAGDQVPLIETDLYNYDRSFWMYNSTWLNLYDDIIRWKGAISEIRKYQEFHPNPALGDQYIAETQVMIGFEMLQAIRLWGDIIIPPSEFPQDLYEAPVTQREDALQYISDLMDEAIPNLPNVRPNERTDIPGGVTAYTAMAVKAMANLELKNWQAVADATSDIINNGGFVLESDYYSLWKKPGKLNSENLLELQYSDFNQGAGENESYLYAFFGPQGWTPAVEGASAGWGFWEPSVKYVKFMLDRGEQERLETTVLFTPDGIAEIESDPDYATLPDWIDNVTRDGDIINNYSRANFTSGKHYLPSNQLTPGRTAYGTGKNFIAIRYSEILLMHAEALTMGATSSAMSADEAVNEVRDRAGLLPLSGVTLQDVLDEKFAEFGMEWGIRFYDLVRHDMTQELNYAGRNYQSPEDRFIPYPLAQLDLLPQLDEL